MNLVQRPAFLSKREMERIHEASLYLLENKGIIYEDDETVEIFRKKGARVDGHLVYLGRELVEECIRLTPSTFTVEAINSKNSVVIGGDNLVIHPAGGEVFLKDIDGARNNNTTIQNFIDLQKIYQACENINMTGYQPLSPADVSLRTRNLRCLYETMLYTDKPWLAPMDYMDADDKNRELTMYEMVFGKEFVQNHYVTWSIVTPESPFIYNKLSCKSIISFARRNQPIALVSAPMSGITAPIHNLGIIVEANTETLAGLCLAQCVHPGIPVLPSASLTYGNLKYATWECASPDTALILSGAIQMYKDYYNIPARAQTGVTSSKIVDYQAGFETMQSFLLTALLGVNVTSQTAGSLENLLTISLEKTIIDDEIIGRVRHILKGIEVNDETLSVDIMMDVKHGENFLMHESTLDNMFDSWQPNISDWNSYDGWAKRGGMDIEHAANIKMKEIIASAKQLLSPDMAKDLKKYIEDCAN